MEQWELAARDFIESCPFKNEIECVFLTGSHATKNADEFSDIDLYIVLNDAVTWRERGNKRVNGLLVEYFANPMRQIKKYIDASYDSVSLIEVNMIRNGIILFDRNAAASELIAYCEQKTQSPFPQMSEFSAKMGLYHLWNSFDELQRSDTRQTPDLPMQFFRFMQDSLELYSRFIGSPVPTYHHLYRWLTEDAYHKNYGLADYKDQEFLNLIKSAFECKNPDAMFDLAKTVYTYVSGNMGGFDIEDFVLHSPCDC